MLQVRVFAGIVMMVSLVGCTTGETARSSSWLAKGGTNPPRTATNFVLLEVALVEQPVSDTYIDSQLWDTVDEQVVSFERKPVLQENGFRVGLVGGLPPPGLQALLTSDRSCGNPRRIQRQAGDPITLSLSSGIPRCQFDLRQEGATQTIAFEQAECSLIIVPSLGKDGSTRLQFTPQVRHGDMALATRPNVDRSGAYSWTLQEHRPTEKYSPLSWEVTIGDNEYVIVGGYADKNKTLGNRFFVDGGDSNPMQRLLVVRTARARPGIAVDEDDSPNPLQSLAAQASLTQSGK